MPVLAVHVDDRRATPVHHADGARNRTPEGHPQLPRMLVVPGRHHIGNRFRHVPPLQDIVQKHAVVHPDLCAEAHEALA